jgi:hypothetical protein
MVSSVTIYQLAYLGSKQSRFSGAVATLLYTALPYTQFFNRTYFGYVIPCLLLGWLAIHYQKWWWSGLCFGLAIIGHFNSLVPVGLSCFWTAVLYFRQNSVREWLYFALGGLIPLVLVEGLFFIHMGTAHPFVWLKGTFGIIFLLSTNSVTTNNWLWVMETIYTTNGAVSLLLLLSLIAPYLLKTHKPLLGLSLSFITLALFYTFQAGATQALIVPRLLVSSYSFWCIGVGITLDFIAGKMPSYSKYLVQSTITVVLLGAVIQTSIFIYGFIQTPYPLQTQWMQKAAKENRPVRYDGNMRIALWDAHINGIELLVNDKQWLKQQAPQQAVLIFTGAVPNALDKSNYEITMVDLDANTDSKFSTLTQEAGIPRHAELWWPTQESKPIKPSYPLDTANAAFYYSGQGCLTPPVYSDGDTPRTLHYYQLVWKRITNVFK